MNHSPINFKKNAQRMANLVPRQVNVQKTQISFAHRLCVVVTHQTITGMARIAVGFLNVKF